MGSQLTQIVAIIGCVTGVAGLLMNFYKVLAERPKLAIEIVNPHINGFIPPLIGYQSNHAAVIILRFTNIGVIPLSIKQVLVTNKNKIFRFFHDAPHPHLEFKTDENTSVYYSFPVNAKLPVLLEVGAVYSATFVFPFSDELYEAMKGRNYLQVKVSITTSTFKKVIAVNLHELSLENIRNYPRKHKDCIDA